MTKAICFMACVRSFKQLNCIRSTLNDPYVGYRIKWYTETSLNQTQTSQSTPSTAILPCEASELTVDPRCSVLRPFASEATTWPLPQKRIDATAQLKRNSFSECIRAKEKSSPYRKHALRHKVELPTGCRAKAAANRTSDGADTSE